MNEYFEADRSLFEKLLNSKVEIIKQICGGNSKISVLKIKNEIIVAKHYMGNVERKRISLEREVSALEFLKAKKVGCVPKVIQVHKELSITFLEYLPGKIPASNKDTLFQMIAFVKLLKNAHNQDNSFPDAVGKVKAIPDLLIQIENRLTSLEYLLPNSNFIQGAHDIFSGLASFNFISIFPPDTYSVSDFGTHNMLCINGSCKFLDLEFFGADSPVKLIADFLLHPQNTFSRPLRSIFYKELKEFFNMDDSVILELLPLYALNWGLIVLRRLEISRGATTLDAEKEILTLAASFFNKALCSGNQILAEAIYLDP